MDPYAFGGLRPLIGRAGYIEPYVVGDKKLGEERIVGGSILAKENGDQQFSIPVSFHPLPVGSLQGPGNLPGHLLTVQLTGVGVQQGLIVNPTMLDFGNTLLNTTSKKSVK